MPGTNVPDQMYTNEFNAVKGFVDQHAVDKAAPVAAGVTFRRGVALQLDPSGEFILGVAGNAMAIFAMQGTEELDVGSDVGNMSGGIVSGLVAAGAYELETAQFDATSYPPNTPLRSGVDGKLEIGVPYTDPIVGVTSDGVITNEWGIDVLRFWPVWLPPTP